MSRAPHRPGQPGGDGRCPSCGAIVARAAEICSMCHSPLAQPARAAPLPQRTGEPRLQTPLESPDPFAPEREAPILAEGEWPCPRCKCALSEETVEGFVLHSCARCGGIMLAGGDVLVQLEQRPEAWAALSHRASELASAAREAIDGRGVAYLQCPTCGGSLARRNFLSFSGIIIDFCHRHGAWCDGGELDQIARFLAKGGAARARARKEQEDNYDRAEHAKFKAVERQEARKHRGRRGWGWFGGSGDV